MDSSPWRPLDRWVPAGTRTTSNRWRTGGAAGGRMWRQRAARARHLGARRRPLTLLGQEANACRYVLHETAGGAASRLRRAPSSRRDVEGSAAAACDRKLRDPALDGLKALPAAVRQPLVAEALDLLTFRFDAWATSLASRRLAEARRATAAGSAAGRVRLGRGPAPRGAVAGSLTAAGGHARSDLSARTRTRDTCTRRRSPMPRRRPCSEAATCPIRQGATARTLPLRSISLPIVFTGPSGCSTASARGSRSPRCSGIGSNAGCTSTASTGYIHRFRTLAGLKDDDTLQQAYDTLRKAEKLAAEVSALYEQRDQANARALDAAALKAEREAATPDLSERASGDRQAESGCHCRRRRSDALDRTSPSTRPRNRGVSSTRREGTAFN